MQYCVKAVENVTSASDMFVIVQRECLRDACL